MKSYIFAIIGVMLLLGATTAHAASALQTSSIAMPSMVSPGNDGYVELTMSNTGTTNVNSITVTLANIDSPIKAKTASYVDSLGSLEPGNSKSVVFRFNVPAGTSSGYYTAQFAIRYCDGSTCTDSIEYSLITVQSQSRIEIESVNPDEIAIGSNSTINLIVKNTGISKIDNVYISWNATDSHILPFGSSNEYYMPSLGGGASGSIPFEIFADKETAAGIYPMVIGIKYDDASGSEVSTSTTVGLRATGYTEFVINTDSSKLIAGKPGITTISIANTGSAAAEFLTVSANSKYGDQKVYVGTIDSDDEETVDIEQAGTSQPYDMNLTMTYRDAFGNQKVYEETIRIKPTSAPFDLGSIINLAILAGVGYWGWKKYIKKK